MKKILRLFNLFFRNMSVLLTSRPKSLFFLVKSKVVFKMGWIVPNLQFTLIIPFYKETDLLRRREYQICLERNLECPYIDQVVVFYENPEKEIESFLSNPRIKVVSYSSGSNRALTYSEVFRYANKHLPDRLVILANADIYFDDSLGKLELVNWRNTVMALTRRNVGAFRTAHIRGYWRMHKASQDCWIFQTPLMSFPSDIFLGWAGCDNMIAYQMNRAGLRVLNPSLDIRIWHLHRQAPRKYVEDGHKYTRQDHGSHQNQDPLGLPPARLPRRSCGPPPGPQNCYGRKIQD